MHKKDQPQKMPPQWIDRLVRRLCARSKAEEIIGDTHERYQLQVARIGEKKARRRYLRESLSYIRLSNMREENKTSHRLQPLTFLNHYLTMALRVTWRNRTFTAINVSGLALGMACFLLIFLWTRSEEAVDSFHSHQQDLYTLYQTTYGPETENSTYSVQEYGGMRDLSYYTELGDELRQNYPEVRYLSEFSTSYELPWGRAMTFQVGDKKHKIEGGTASEDFFKMFSYPLVAGTAENALKGLNVIAISETMATTFFGSAAEAMGQLIRYENVLDLEVKAVFKDLDSRSSLQFEYLISWENTEKDQVLLSEGDYSVFVQLQPGSNHKDFAAKIKNLQNEKYDYNPGHGAEFGVQPFNDRYLISQFENRKPVSGKIEYIRIFKAVALFVLLIACVNFMNLTTAKALKRAKEVGVRKVVGSTRRYLVGQFMGESILLSLLALGLSLLLVALILPVFNNFAGKEMRIPLGEPSYWLFIAGLALVSGLLSGLYPALYLSSLKPIGVLKGKTRFSRSASQFRKVLAVFQFSLSSLLLIGTLVVSRQTDYVQNKQLGYDRENVVYLRIEGTLNPKYHVFKERLLTQPGIAMVDRSSEAPHNMGFEMSTPFRWEGQEKDRYIGFRPTSVGFDFLTMMGLEVVEGRGFSKDIATDTTAFMVNETALRQMRMTDPLGKWISAWDKRGPIIGIVKDYHISSLHERIKPLIIDVKEDLSFGIIMIKTEPGMLRQGLESLEAVCAEINPDFPLDYQIMDQEYASLYQSEVVISKLSNVFAALAVIISCLGLLGLAMFTTEHRVKEIGIRKVLGASATGIVSMLSKEFIGLVILGFLISAPIAWYLMKDWLNDFAYSIDLNLWVFVLTGGVAMLVAWLTVSFQTYKAAANNPVASLRAE